MGWRPRNRISISHKFKSADRLSSPLISLPNKRLKLFFSGGKETGREVATPVKIVDVNDFREAIPSLCRSQWPRVLRRRSAAACLLEIVGSNPSGGMDVCLL